MVATRKKRNTRAEAIPSKFQVWKLAMRPHTLTASVVPVAVGYALSLRMIREHPDVFFPLPHDVHRAAPSYGHDYGHGHDALPPGAGPSLPLLSVQFASFAALVQISTNLHNDYADYVRGADTDERLGQERATQRGWLTPYETCRGCALCLCAALWVGARYLIPIHEGMFCGGGGETNDGTTTTTTTTAIDDVDVVGGGGYYRRDPVMALVVLSSVFNAVAYTGGPFPLGYVGLGDVSIGYSGLGDLFVFLYFGIVATVGVPYLYLTRSMTAAYACLRHPTPAAATASLLWRPLRASFLHSVPVGSLATAIIVVNNLRDRRTDVTAGKRTTAVRFGEKFARVEYFVLVLGSYAFCACSYLLSSTGRGGGDGSTTAWTALLPLASFPLAMSQLRAVAFGGKDGRALNDHVGGTAKLQMIYCLLMAAGLAISP
ncbi:hypothetical protein ACHAW5_003811 [Stephanodiscus triporus]|uniref:1,4-dihydroxy-2-naphthoate octaprenyltransferase n=1 Tax=Stephanodiscus triporus TaxID=2934178 RepID=A0ABD3PZ49_9STRA